MSESYFCIIIFPVFISLYLFFFFFNDTATTEIYTLSLHDALPISSALPMPMMSCMCVGRSFWRSEEHTSELQSRFDLVCRLLLEKKKKFFLHIYNNVQINFSFNLSAWRTVV